VSSWVGGDVNATHRGQGGDRAVDSNEQTKLSIL
jgi:hypothetical protein